ncbi:MAG: GAF and ANTAR domain-containing protein [Elusimicrobia bacterium]|nr:GAF and ANTAR domain-containing protein [Candidatus Liberimonas magnetica]
MKTKKAKTTSVKDLKIEIALLYKIIEIIGQSTNLNELMQQIAKVLASTLKCDSCFIYLLEDSKLVLSGAWPPHPFHLGKLILEKGEGITGWVAEHKKPVSLQKNAFKDPRFKIFTNLPEDRFAAILSAPIILNSKTIGVINLQNKSRRDFNKQSNLLVSISSQIAGAIEKTKLLQVSNKKTKQLETIARLSRSIVSNTYLYEILQLIVTMTAQTMNSKICSLMLYNEKTHELKIEATQSLSEDYTKKPPIKVGQSVSGKALELKQPVTVLDVTTEPNYNYPEIARREGLCSMIAVPMLVKDKPVGVINCYTTEKHNFSEEEINVLQTIAIQSAIAIENTRLFEESKVTRESLETRKIVERAKGILMRERGLAEEEAFRFLQKQAMNMRRSMREIAEAVLLSDGIKKP